MATRDGALSLNRHGDTARTLPVTRIIAAPDEPEFEIIGVAGVEIYTYVVEALTAFGGSTGSGNSVGIDTGNAVLSVSNAIRLSWIAVAGATGYRVWRMQGPDDTGHIATLDADTLEFLDTGVAVVFATFETENMSGAGRAVNTLGIEQSFEISGDFVGTIQVQSTDNLAVPWDNVGAPVTAPGSFAAISFGDPPRYHRAVELAYTSGSYAVRMAGFVPDPA